MNDANQAISFVIETLKVRGAKNCDIGAKKININYFFQISKKRFRYIFLVHNFFSLTRHEILLHYAGVFFCVFAMTYILNSHSPLSRSSSRVHRLVSMANKRCAIIQFHTDTKNNHFLLSNRGERSGTLKKV